MKPPAVRTESVSLPRAVVEPCPPSSPAPEPPQTPEGRAALVQAEWPGPHQKGKARVQAIVDLWDAWVPEELADRRVLVAPIGRAGKQLETIAARWPDFATWDAIFRRVWSSAFLRGERGGDGWRGATFDWLLREPGRLWEVGQGRYHSATEVGRVIKTETHPTPVARTEPSVDLQRLARLRNAAWLRDLTLPPERVLVELMAAEPDDDRLLDSVQDKA